MGEASVWTPSLKLMDRAGVERLHRAAVEILETTGLHVHHPEMRQKLLDAGARPGAAIRVYLPGEMVERSLKTAKRGIVVHNRLGEPVMPLAPHQVYFGTGSDLLNTRDAQTRQRRQSVQDDAARAARLCDALDDIDFVMSFALPTDAPELDIEPRQYYAMLSNTTKPVIMTSFSGLEVLERMHEMACLIAGGEKAFRERPNYILYGQFISPLEHDRLAIERLIFCAEHEIPLIYIPAIMPGASGPITLAGSLALAAAESLAGLVMNQTERPGAPFIFGACVSQLDMRTMLFPYGSPDWRLSDLAMAELARHYGLPVFGTAGATDSKIVDAQTGAEYGTSMLVAALAGINLIHDLGYLESGLTGSLESIVLGAEQVRWVRHFMAGVEVSEDTLAGDVVAAVGPGKQFLDHDHTLEHLRRLIWTPYVTDRYGYDAWAHAGAKDYATRAREFALDLLRAHESPAIDGSLDRQLRELCNMSG
jgi:trimethylamine--corrinoid protein Co-methyltransferase